MDLGSSKAVKIQGSFWGVGISPLTSDFALDPQGDLTPLPLAPGIITLSSSVKLKVILYSYLILKKMNERITDS